MYKPTKPYKYKILKLIESTWNTPYIKVSQGIYPIIEKKFLYFEIDHTDGIGTKGFYHWKAETFKVAVIDAFAMNLNDLALARAVPYKLSNHITVPVEDERVIKIVQEMVKLCRKHRVAIVGGENSFHDNLDGLDISMTVSGFVKNQKPNQFKVGDTLVGLKSSGIHSNGFTMVRRIFGNKIRPVFTVPTTIYLDTILKLAAIFDIHGMMNITGGAFTKLKDVLGKADARIVHTQKLMPQAIFTEIYEKGISNKTMYSTFNCGIGFILSVPKHQAAAILCKIKNAGIIGEVVRGDGHIQIQSAFNGKMVIL